LDKVKKCPDLLPGSAARQDSQDSYIALPLHQLDIALGLTLKPSGNTDAW